MPQISVTDQDGKNHQLEAKSGTAVMEPLRDADLIEATCGGAASCGTCHIYLRGDWPQNSGERTEDEGYMLEGLEDFVEIREGSRLSCQVKVTDAHENVKIEIAPEA